MCFFVSSINFARTREGRPARRKLTEVLVKSKKNIVTDPAAIFFVFQVNISCKTTSIILYFKYASFSVVTRKKRQNTNPHPDGNFFVDRFGLGILHDAERSIYCVKISVFLYSPLWIPIRRSSLKSGLWRTTKSFLTASSKCNAIRDISAAWSWPILIGRPDTTMYASPIVSTWNQLHFCHEGHTYNTKIVWHFA